MKIAISELHPDPANVRKHSDKNIKAIEASLARFGQQKPIVIDLNNIVRAGNGTLQAAINLGWNEIWVHKSDLEGSELTAYAIADNRTAELAEWDMQGLQDQLASFDTDLQAIAFDGFEFDFGVENSSEPSEKDDEIPEVDENPYGVKTGDIWQLGKHRLMCGDSTIKENVDRLMDGQKADMVFTDPPYGVSYTDKNVFLNELGAGDRLTKPIENDHATIPEMYDLWCKVFNIICEYSTDKCSYYICSPQGGELMMMMQAIDQSPFSLKHTLIWAKNNHVLGRCDYNYKHEPILYGWKKKGTHKFYGKGQCKTSVWNFDKPLANKLHPTMKPVELVCEAILNSSEKENLLLEPFCGSGSTLIACQKTNRKAFGLEIDPHYCSVIIKRWEDFTGLSARRLS